MTNLLRLVIQRHQAKGKRYLLTSYNVNDVTVRTPGDDYVMLMAQGTKQDLILHLVT